MLFSKEINRPRRQVMTDLASRLASMSPNVPEDIFFNTTNASSLSNETNLTTESLSVTTTTTVKLILKPSVVETDKLKQSLVAKPSSTTSQSNEMSTCTKVFCCYSYSHNTNQNETLTTNPFSCQENDVNQSNDCKEVVPFCKNSTLQVCYFNKTSAWCRIDQICGNDPKLDCSLQLINLAINASSSTTTLATLISTVTTTTTTVTPLTTSTTTTAPVTPTTTTVMTTIVSTTTTGASSTSTTDLPSTSTITSTTTTSISSSFYFYFLINE